MKWTRWGLGMVSLASLLLSVDNSDAGWLHHCGHGCCETRICVRPYNAFTPVCWGTLNCDGCAALPCPIAPHMYMSPCGNMLGGGGPVGAAFNGFPMGYGDAFAGMPGYQPLGAPMGLPFGAGAPGVPTGAPMGTPPANWAPMPNAVPMPMPMPPAGNVPPGLRNTAQMPYPMWGYGVQPANFYPGYYGYQPAYYPGYNPAAYGAYGYGAYGYGAYPGYANPAYAGYGYGYGQGYDPYAAQQQQQAQQQAQQQGQQQQP